MELIKIKTLYDFISLYATILYFYSFIRLFYKRDIYIFIGVLIATIGAKIIKRLTQDMNPNIFKRPDNACDTNPFNLGGYAGNRPGFPSGHTFLTSYVMYYLILKNNNSFFELDSLIKQIIIIIVAYARVKKGAHRTIQVVAGYIFGLLLACIMIYGVNNLFFLETTNTLPYF